jgi:energy-coupling factor transporter ATP-binding protein EcfA2
MNQVLAEHSDALGVVLEISGGGAVLALDSAAMRLEDADVAVAMSGRVGGHVRIAVGGRWVLAYVRSQKHSRRAEEGIITTVDFLGEGGDAAGALVDFRRGVEHYPLPGCMVHRVSTCDLQSAFGAQDALDTVAIGMVYPTHNIPARLGIDAFLGKHFALIGSTGTGKSTALALILHRICEAAPHGQVVMIDPHGEYAKAFGGQGMLLDVSNLALPYWLMNFEEHCEILLSGGPDTRDMDAEILAKCLLAARQKGRHTAGRITVDSPVPYLMTDLVAILHNEMGRLEKTTTTAPYLRIRARIEELRSDPRFQFLFSGVLVSDTMADTLGRLFRVPSQGQPIAIIDVSGVPSDVTSTVVALLSRLVFDFAVWSRGDGARPILLVCEEAHRYVPNERNADGSAVARSLSRIAKEGRKYGVALGLVTQRPSDLAEGVLSQCGTILAMRLNNERDQAFVRAAMPEGARGFLDAIPALRNREAIVAGEGVSIPLRIRFDDLEPEKRPASNDPSFAQIWQQASDPAMVERTVGRWRARRA